MNTTKIKDFKEPLEIKFDERTFIKTIPAVDIFVESIKIVQIVDLPASKKVIANTFANVGPVVLWEGEAYDNIGEWTDEQVMDRINELFANKEKAPN